jgi:plastocyanin
LALVALNIAYDKHELETAADQPFTISFDNQDPSTPHDVDIRDASGNVVADQQPVTGPAQVDYAYDPLPAGQYTFTCSIHPIPAMTGTLTVR